MYLNFTFLALAGTILCHTFAYADSIDDNEAAKITVLINKYKEEAAVANYPEIDIVKVVETYQALKFPICGNNSKCEAKSLILVGLQYEAKHSRKTGLTVKSQFLDDPQIFPYFAGKHRWIGGGGSPSDSALKGIKGSASPLSSAVSAELAGKFAGIIFTEANGAEKHPDPPYPCGGLFLPINPECEATIIPKLTKKVEEYRSATKAIIKNRIYSEYKDLIGELEAALCNDKIEQHCAYIGATLGGGVGAIKEFKDAKTGEVVEKKVGVSMDTINFHASGSYDLVYGEKTEGCSGYCLLKHDNMAIYADSVGQGGYYGASKFEIKMYETPRENIDEKEDDNSWRGSYDYNDVEPFPGASDYSQILAVGKNCNNDYDKNRQITMNEVFNHTHLSHVGANLKSEASPSFKPKDWITGAEKGDIISMPNSKFLVTADSYNQAYTVTSSAGGYSVFYNVPDGNCIEIIEPFTIPSISPTKGIK